MYQRWQLFIIVTIAILAGLILGSLNVLIRSILNKRKEYAVLRTLRVTKGKLVATVLTQVFTFEFLGMIMGIIIGVLVANIITLCDTNTFSKIDLKLMYIVLTSLITITLLTFTPITLKIAKHSIINELKQN